VFHHDPFSAHAGAVDTLAGYGIAPPPEWSALRARFSAYGTIDKPMAARLAAAILEPKSSADIAELRALALAEESATNLDEGAVTAAVRDAVHDLLLALYKPVALKNYKAVAAQFDDAAKAFVKAANVIDPEATSDAIVYRDDKTRQAWLAAAVAAKELDELVPVLAAAAELAGAPAGTSLRQSAADGLVLALTTHAGMLHRRRIWEAWAAVGTCGRWSALHRLGATIRAHRDPTSLTEYRAPRPYSVTWLNGGERRVVDPEDNPKAPLVEHDWSAV
jgi:hypothetical protein